MWPYLWAARPSNSRRGLAVCARFRVDFAQAEDYLLARQLGQAEERAAAAEQQQQQQQQQQEEEGDIPMPGQDLVSVGAMVVGTGEGVFQDGAATVATFRWVAAMLRPTDGRVLVADSWNHRIRMLSADLQQVSTVAGDGGQGHRDGAAAQAQFRHPSGLKLLTDGRVLIADQLNHRIRVLSADLQQVSTVAGDGEQGHRDGAAAQAQFTYPCGLALLLTVAVVDYSNRIRVLSADLQQVSTLTNVGELIPSALDLLPDGRLLVGGNNSIRVLEGFPAALLGAKPSYKRPKRTGQQQQKEKKRALAGGASSTGRLVPKRSRSGASSSSSMAAPSSSDSEGEEQPGGSAAEAEPLI